MRGGEAEGGWGGRSREDGEGRSREDGDGRSREDGEGRSREDKDGGRGGDGEGQSTLGRRGHGWMRRGGACLPDTRRLAARVAAVVLPQQLGRRRQRRLASRAQPAPALGHAMHRVDGRWLLGGGGDAAERDKLLGGRHRAPQVQRLRVRALFLPDEPKAQRQRQQLVDDRREIVGGGERVGGRVGDLEHSHVLAGRVVALRGSRAEHEREVTRQGRVQGDRTATGGQSSAREPRVGRAGARRGHRERAPARQSIRRRRGSGTTSSS